MGTKNIHKHWFTTSEKYYPTFSFTSEFLFVHSWPKLGKLSIGMNVLDPLSRSALQTGPWLSSLNVNHESRCLMLFPLPWRSHFSAVTFSEPPRCLSQRPAGRQWRQPLNGYLSGCNWFVFLHSLSNLCMNSAVWMSMCGLLSCGQCHAWLPAHQQHSQLVLFNVGL